MEPFCPTLLGSVPESKEFKDIDWTDACVLFRTDPTTLKVHKLQSCAVGLGILLTPWSFAHWLHRKSNQEMLKRYQDAVQKCCSRQCSSQFFGELSITHNNSEITTICAIQVSSATAVKLASTSDQDLEPECIVTLMNFKQVVPKKFAQFDRSRSVVKRVGTSKCIEKHCLGDTACDTQSLKRNRCIISL